jgi:hypothetical protein
MIKNIKPKDLILIIFTACCIVTAFCFKPISQDSAYHHFADQRSIFGVSNFYNVITNLPFLIIGVIGFIYFLKLDQNRFSSIAHLTLFIGVIGIGIGSAWYHYRPTNDALVWDRIPMTVTFMSYFSIILSRYVNFKVGRLLLFPLLIVGVFSVFYWHLTEQYGSGDLRLYALVQFYPMLCIPLILVIYPASKSVRIKIVSVILVYVIAKLAEHGDEVIYNFHHILSGHSLKHLLASASIWLIVLTLKDGVPEEID